MKAKILFLIFGTVLVTAIAYRLTSATREPDEAAPSGAEVFRIDNAIYDRVAKAAQAGDCDAAFSLARHHAFATSKYEEAIVWYRMAAKCPHVGAKRELLSMLIDLPARDFEVDRLLSEIEQLDPKAAASDRRDVALARANR